MTTEFTPEEKRKLPMQDHYLTKSDILCGDGIRWA